ncbi:MAG: hypothetical protein AAFZ18_35065, partial [Myxococcota bacterium]
MSKPSSRFLQIIQILLLCAILIAVVLCCWFRRPAEEQAPPPLPDLNELGQLTTKTATKSVFVPDNGCSSEEFFVDVSEGAAHPSPSFRANLEASLTASLRANYCRWYVKPRQEVASGCVWNPIGSEWVLSPTVRSAVRAEVEAVFPERRDESSGCLLHDGHLRFFRVRFLRDGLTQPVPTPALCSIQAEIQRHAELIASDNPSTPVPLCTDPTPTQHSTGAVAFEVGRECPVRTLGLTPTRDMLDWHHDQLGSLQETPPARSVSDAVRPVTYLVDTGVYPSVGAATSVDGAGAAGRLDPHGSALAVMMRELSPSVPASTERISVRGLPPVDAG